MHHYSDLFLFKSLHFSLFGRFVFFFFLIFFRFSMFPLRIRRTWLETLNKWIAELCLLLKNYVVDNWLSAHWIISFEILIFFFGCSCLDSKLSFDSSIVWQRIVVKVFVLGFYAFVTALPLNISLSRDKTKNLLANFASYWFVLVVTRHWMLFDDSFSRLLIPAIRDFRENAIRIRTNHKRKML